MKKTIEVEYLLRPSIEAEQEMVQNMAFDIEADLGFRWMDTIIHYLKDGSLYQKIVVKLTELRVKLAGIGYHLNINCTEDHTMVPTLGVYT